MSVLIGVPIVGFIAYEMWKTLGENRRIRKERRKKEAIDEVRRCCWSAEQQSRPGAYPISSVSPGIKTFRDGCTDATATHFRLCKYLSYDTFSWMSARICLCLKKGKIGKHSTKRKNEVCIWRQQHVPAEPHSRRSEQQACSWSDLRGTSPSMLITKRGSCRKQASCSPVRCSMKHLGVRELARMEIYHNPCCCCCCIATPSNPNPHPKS